MAFSGLRVYAGEPTLEDVLASLAGSGYYQDECPCVFEAPLVCLGGTNNAPTTCVPMDVKETAGGFEFVADVPGVKRSEIQVQITEGSILSISWRRTPPPAADDHDKYIRRERSTGSFVRKFRLPQGVDFSAVRATCESGVLTVSVPKLKPPEPKVVSIEVQ